MVSRWKNINFLTRENVDAPILVGLWADIYFPILISTIQAQALYWFIYYWHVSTLFIIVIFPQVTVVRYLLNKRVYQQLCLRVSDSYQKPSQPFRPFKLQRKPLLQPAVTEERSQQIRKVPCHHERSSVRSSHFDQSYWSTWECLICGYQADQMSQKNVGRRSYTT